MTAISRKVVIGRRHCTMHLNSDGNFSVEWNERPNQFTAQELTQYLEVRNALIKSMIHELSANGKVTEAYAHASWEETAA
jgi:hypothetical protein